VTDPAYRFDQNHRRAANRNAPSNARDHGHRAAAGRPLMLSAA
jgi:hypothetical protein